MRPLLCLALFVVGCGNSSHGKDPTTPDGSTKGDGAAPDVAAMDVIGVPDVSTEAINRAETNTDIPATNDAAIDVPKTDTAVQAPGDAGDAAVPPCTAGSCGAGKVCVHYVNQPNRPQRSICHDSPCGTDPVTCTCAQQALCEGAGICSNGTGELSCLFSVGAP